MITEARYKEYIQDFNSTFAPDGLSLEEFFDKYYEPDATFEYVPQAKKNVGREQVLEFWHGVSGLMDEKILDHTHFLATPTAVASEAPIDFVCKQDMDWVGVQHKAGSKFRLMMAAFYDVSPNDKFSYVRVYSIYNPAYNPD